VAVVALHSDTKLSLQLPPTGLSGKNRLIGSGVTEAGCKEIIKARLCAARMNWKELGASIVLSLRTLSYLTGRWQQFWEKLIN
jgi:hypothetical protein